MFPRFTFPWALLLLMLVPLSIWLGVKIRSLPPIRKWMAVSLRTIILLCLIMALAGAELVRRTDRLAVFYLIDRSNSIPEGVREWSVQSIVDTCETYMTDKDEVGVIAFGEDASIELTVDPTLELDEVRSFVGGEQTDIAAAVRLAMAAFPQGYMRRIVLLSDGNETQGVSLEEIKLAQASGVAVDVLPLEIAGGAEVRLREVAVPNRVNADEPFKLQIVADADQDCEGTLRVYQRVASGKRLLSAVPVTLQEGSNAWLLPQELNSSGFYEYEATIESDADTVMANNEGRAFTLIHGEPRVLYIDADADMSTYLEPALLREGVRVVRRDPGGMPTSLGQLQNFDALVMANVSATDVSSDQLKIIEAAVRDLGIGLVMVGGPETFGAGGYYDSPVERALPVNMDIKQRKIMPRGALVLIMHTCEFDQGNVWARDIAVASLNVLSSQDLMGALGYDYQAQDSWIFELQPVGGKTHLRAALNTGNIGDMPAIQPTLLMAYESLAKADASVKRIVMISDGDPAPPTSGLLKKLAKAKIAVSTVCINPHRPNDQRMLKWVAEMTGGKYYFVRNPNNLPQIFTKEAAVVRRSLLYEKPFIPKPQHDSELLHGFLANPFPQLKGYVLTSPKDNATIPLVSTEGDPVLAHWRYGLGKAVAYTSGVTTRWAGDWVVWDGFNRFWAQTVRWAVREISSSDFQVETRVKGSMGYIKIDAVDDRGQFVNFLRPRGVVSGPAPGFARSEVALVQTGPGIYEGRFPVSDPGIYMININYQRPDGSEGMLPAGLALNYSREYEYNTTNTALLEHMAEMGGGKVLGPGANPFQHDLEVSPTVTSIWQFLVGLAACLFPIEVFVRRVVVDFRAVFAWLAKMLRRLPGLQRLIPAPAARPRLVTGSYGGMQRESRARVFTAAGMDLPQRREGATGGDDMMAPPPGAEAPEKPVGDIESDAPGHSEYTRQLLAAKKRALESRKKSK